MISASVQECAVARPGARESVCVCQHQSRSRSIKSVRYTVVLAVFQLEKDTG